MSPREQVIFFLRAWDEMEQVAVSAKPQRCLFLFQRNGRLNPFE
jgi:hypothetical protein